ncbi:hypothetical protein OCS_05199 [Ophiocordyceps sinensis CO18]|uniref:Cytochrome oxidase c assembly domain-containing protein n=1 Tax=Ophiocordyceps sinensis (strain Co18 / CGMCC 3.14243) TaxID=911162 RepID=T5A926_OPHSC|nr:hypothetical protein OCS_05199 [Ophiocordyceps sinensis CO18]
MATRIGPRSVKDATRFTSTVPHATSKSAGATPQSRISGETPEQRVRRLRLAHLAAQKAQISRTDRFVDVSRKFLDVAHRWTVGGIVIFTAVAGVVSIYSVWDMLRYNRARRTEWVQAQKMLEADSLSVARVAYLKGEATKEQITLVEEANREAEEKGTKLPPLLSPPEHRTHFEERVKPALQGAEYGQGTGKGVLGCQPYGDDGSESASSEGGVVQSIETTAKKAWDEEKEKQRKGGGLDQLGLDSASSSPAPSVKKRWWPW